MGLIKEPLNVDFYTTGKQMTDEDQKRVSDYLKKELKKPRNLKKKNKKQIA